MKHSAILVLGALMFGPPAAAPIAFAQSAPVTSPTLTEVTFDVPDMTCGTCPITVRMAMSRVEGVQSVVVDLYTRSAHVVFDPALTNAAAIAKASEEAGYPAAVQG